MSTNTVTDISKIHEETVERLPGGMGGFLKEWGLLQYANELLNGVSSAPNIVVKVESTDMPLDKLQSLIREGGLVTNADAWTLSERVHPLVNANPPTHTTFKLGDPVTKKSGSRWTGKVVGFYSTDLTPEGYAVESDTEAGSVQIYPAKALELVEVTANPTPQKLEQDAARNNKYCDQ